MVAISLKVIHLYMYMDYYIVLGIYWGYIELYRALRKRALSMDMLSGGHGLHHLEVPLGFSVSRSRKFIALFSPGSRAAESIIRHNRRADVSKIQRDPKILRVSGLDPATSLRVSKRSRYPLSVNFGAQ